MAGEIVERREPNLSCVCVPGGRERKRRWVDYEEDEPLDPLPAGWLQVAEEGEGAQKVPLTHAIPLLSEESCNRRFRGSDARGRRGEGGCDDGCSGSAYCLADENARKGA